MDPHLYGQYMTKAARIHNIEKIASLINFVGETGHYVKGIKLYYFLTL